MIKHRLNELTDAEWLEDYEKDRWPGEAVHGKGFLDRRTAFARQAPFPFSRRPPNKKVVFWLRWRSYVVWTVGLGVFGLAGLAIFILAAIGTRVLTT
jgi:hypothetical protein